MLVYKIEKLRFLSNIEKTHFPENYVCFAWDCSFYFVLLYVICFFSFAERLIKRKKTRSVSWPTQNIHTKTAPKESNWCCSDVFNWTCDFRTFQLAVKTNLEILIYFCGNGSLTATCKYPWLLSCPDPLLHLSACLSYVQF